MQQSKFKKIRCRKVIREASEEAERAQLLTFSGDRGEEAMWAHYLGQADVKLLLYAGEYLYRMGCRAGFDELITDMYLKNPFRQRWGRLLSVEAQRLRELIEGEDAAIEPKLIEPRLQKIRDKIEIIILNHLTS